MHLIHALLSYLVMMSLVFANPFTCTLVAFAVPESAALLNIFMMPSVLTVCGTRIPYIRVLSNLMRLGTIWHGLCVDYL